jgi:hypothetical protein
MADKETTSLVDETFNKIFPQEKKRELTADEHLRVQKEIIDKEGMNPLIHKLQREAQDETFGIGLEQAAPKKRGRPPKTPQPVNLVTAAPLPGSKESTPVRSRSKTPPPSPRKKEDSGVPNLRRIKQISAMVKLYPHLSGILPPLQSLHLYPSSELDSMFKVCKEEADGGGADGLEYEIVKNTFYGIITHFESLCALVCATVFKGPTGPPMILQQLASNPPGSFKEYMVLANEAGDGVDLELREMSIELIGLFPKSVFLRFFVKMGYKIYDFQTYQHNNYLRRMQEELRDRSSGGGGEMPAHVRAQMDAIRQKKGILKK